MKTLAMLSVLWCTLLFSRSYNILDPGDPDLSQEKKDSKLFKSIQEKNVNEKPFPIKNPQTFFERGVLKAGTRVCLMGDPGNGSKRQMLIGKLMQRECDQIRLLGDIIYYVGAKDRNDPLLASRFLNVYKDLTTPMYIILGNHDYGQNPDIYLDVAKEFPKKYIFPNNYYMEFFSNPKNKGMCFISLDTTPIANVNPAIGLKAPRVKAQMAWLDSIQNLIKNRCSFTFSFTHHPFVNVSKGRDEGVTDMVRIELYEKRLLKYVNMVVTGHDHFLGYHSKLPKSGFPGQFHNIPQILSGSGGMLAIDKEMEIPPYSKAFKETGFVQMTLLQNSDNPKFAARFRYINHLGAQLLDFNYP